MLNTPNKAYRSAHACPDSISRPAGTAASAPPRPGGSAALVPPPRPDRRHAARFCGHLCPCQPGLGTWDVYGDGGLSEIAGRPVMENLRLEAGGADLEPLLLDGIVSEVADYVPGLE